MATAEFEPAVPASERAKTHALDRAANGTGTSSPHSHLTYVDGGTWKHVQGLNLLYYHYHCLRYHLYAGYLQLYT